MRSTLFLSTEPLAPSLAIMPAKEMMQMTVMMMLVRMMPTIVASVYLRKSFIIDILLG